MYSNYIQILFWLQANHVKKAFTVIVKNNIKMVDGHSGLFIDIKKKKKKFLKNYAVYLDAPGPNLSDSYIFKENFQKQQNTHIQV